MATSVHLSIRFGLAVLIGALSSSVTMADDTEVFFAPQSATSSLTSNILFMFDTSGSMDGLDGGTTQRIDRLKKAMIDVVDSGSNVRIGIGAFNGIEEGGSIMLPPVAIDEDRCENASCGSITSRSIIRTSADDGRELYTGEVKLFETLLPMAENTDTSVPQEDIVGMRFPALNIPQGATITGASIRFRPEVGGDSTVNYTISAQNIGHAPEFAEVNGNLSSRTRTSAATNASWTPGDWADSDEQQTTADFSAAVQEVVNRTDWCGGNAMAVFISGPGQREIFAYDDDRWNAPVLDITYDPASVDFANTCTSQRTQASITNSADDVTEPNGSQIIDSTNPVLETHTATIGNTIGLRFSNVNIPQGATVTSAYLFAVSAGVGGGTANLDIEGENTPYSPAFNAATPGHASSRTRTSASVLWSDVPDEPIGNGLRSPNLSPIINEIVGQATWAPYNTLTLLLSGLNSNTGIRYIKSFDDGAPPKLIVNYQLDSADTGGAVVTLRTGRDDLVDTMLSFRPEGGTPLVDAYYEAAVYMSGGAVEFGKKRGNAWTSERFFRVSAPETYTGGTVVRDPLCTDLNLNAEECASENITGTPVYDPPVPAACQANQIVLLSDGSATYNNATSLIQSKTGLATCATRSNTNEDCALELGEWLLDTDHFNTITGDQPIITHTVGFSFSSPFLEELATAGGGGFYTANTSGELVKVFSNIINNAADINTSFVAPSGSLSQTNRLTNSNDLYFGMFNPNNTARWDGNLKKYQLAISPSDASKTIVVDADGDPAFDATLGGIADGTRSLWSATADGPDVTKGGAASNLTLSRNILTYTDTTGTTIPLVDLSETQTDITAALLQIDSTQTTYRSELLQWARGVDLKDYDKDGNTSEVRVQMGDPLHSVPVLLNYTTQSVVFVGTNEGFLHAIDADAGTEEFAFIPKDLLKNLDKFYADEPTVERVYGLDGPITAWIEDGNDNGVVDSGESAYVVVGMRRGGRNYYALDVSDPQNPSIAWIIEGGVGDFAELGQSWSKPVKTRVNIGSTPTDVLVFAAGYDTLNDDKVQRATDDSVGRGFYVVNAKTGERLAHKGPSDLTDLEYSIPSTMRVIDINVDGLADTLFVGDMGAQLWRFDINNNGGGTLSSAITGGVIADLGGVADTENRRFYNEPDVSIMNDPQRGDFLNIAIGSGWRAHPLNQGVQDQFYSVRSHAIYGPPLDNSGSINYAAVKIVETDLFDATNHTGESDTTNKIGKGWYINLDSGGEKSMSRSITINGKVLFTTYLPDTASVSACDVSVGSGRIYVIDGVYAKPIADLDGSGSGAVLTTSDRRKNLTAPGIPPNVSALIPEINEKSPVLLVGTEVLPGVDFGQLFRKTFWAEN